MRTLDAPPAASIPAPAPVPEAARVPRARLDAIDLVRGLVMVLMLLDHTREFVHEGALAYEPTDLSRASAALFLTRWVTHFCAPLFVFLAGSAAYFQRARGKAVPELRRFLVKRGLWLVLLELTVVRMTMLFDGDLRLLAVLQVIFAIGVSMIALAALVGLPTRVVGAIGVGIVATHNLLDRVHVPAWAGPESPVPSAGAKLFMLLHQPGPFPIAGWPSPIVVVVYPVLAWIGVIAAGYAFGAVYDLAPEVRRRTLFRLGAAMCALFLVLRATELYGDPLGWQLHHPRGPLFAALSFIDTQKYPPSLLYLLMTLGPGVLLLGALDGRLGAAEAARAPARWIVTFGRVPMFYYLLQWPTAHLIAIAPSAAAGKATWVYFVNPITFATTPPPATYGFPLWVVYAAWAVGVLLLYPACRWYAAYKATHRAWWLSYL
jgi:uncharacterized membrane protein